LFAGGFIQFKPRHDIIPAAYIVIRHPADSPDLFYFGFKVPCNFVR